MAYPLDAIVVDGQLDDWPADRAWYPIAIAGGGGLPIDAEDLTARFKVGYNVEEHALYVAVEVQDQSVVIDSSRSPEWYTQDGCEIYLDPLHRRKDVAFDRYGVHGPYQQAYPRKGGKLPLAGRPEVNLKLKHQGHHIIYEWRIDVARLYDQNALRNGQTIGLEVAITDCDLDGTVSWLAWGGGIGETATLGWLGDVLLATSPEELGYIHGKAVWERSSEPLRRGQVQVQSTDKPDLFWDITTSPDGAFKVALPEGNYRAVLPTGLKGPSEPFIITPGQLHQVDLKAQYPQGRTVTAGKRQRQLIKPSIQLGGWQHLGIPDGLPHSNVWSIIQDREGHMWFGTYGGGAARYNGHAISIFGQQEGLADSIYCMVEDHKGHIWFGTQEGIYRYDGLNFTAFSTDEGLPNRHVWDMAVVEDQGLWISTDGGGAAFFDGHKFDIFTSADGLSSNRPRNIYIETTGQVWFGSWGGGTTRYDGRDFTRFTQLDGLVNDFVNDIVEDHNHDLWMVTEMSGASRFDGKRFHDFSPAQGLIYNHVTTSLVDRDGRVWFGTRLGLSTYHAGEIRQYTSADGLPGDSIRDLYEDSEGSIWLGGVDIGVARFEGRRMGYVTNDDGLPGSLAWSVFEDAQKRLWIGTEDGLLRISKKDTTVYYPKDGLGKGPGGKFVRSFLEDRQGQLWIGTEGGLVHYQDGRFNTFTTQDGLPHNEIFDIAEDRQGQLWLATDGGGVSRFDGRSFTNFTTDDGLGTNQVPALLQDSKGLWWFGSKEGGGVTRYDGTEFLVLTTADGLAGNSVWSIVEDQAGNLWFGTDGSGVTRYDGQHFKNYSAADGLGGNSVWAMLADPDGILWFGTDGGVSRFDGTVFQTLTSGDGLIHNHITDLFRDSQGRIWITSRGGASWYRPEHASPGLKITNVIADHPLGEGPDKVTLMADQDYLAIEFAGHSLKTRANAMLYRYRLRGLTDQWQTSRSERAEFLDLPIGEYQFEVQAIDRDLDYSPIATLAIHVRRSVGKLALYSTLFVAVALFLGQTVRVYKRGHRLQSANQQLQLQANDLQETTLQAQHASQEARRANLAKTTFLASLSHELRTPMHTIVGFTDLLQGEWAKELKEEARDSLVIIRRNADYLLELINQVLNLAQIETGQMEVMPEACDLRVLTENAMATIAPLVHNKPIELKTICNDDLPKLYTDPGKLNQILLNLLGNATKFTDAGKIHVVLTHADGQVQINVKDTGNGIPPDKLDAIFEEFHQLGSAHKIASMPGSGLGLAITRRLTHLLGGTITAASTPGQGSCFTVELPYRFAPSKNPGT